MKAYRQYIEQGIRARYPKKQGNLWVLEYKMTEYNLSSKLDLENAKKNQRKRKYAKIK